VRNADFASASCVAFPDTTGAWDFLRISLASALERMMSSWIDWAFARQDRTSPAVSSLMACTSACERPSAKYPDVVTLQIDGYLELGLGGCKSFDGGWKGVGLDRQRRSEFIRKSAVDGKLNKGSGNLPRASICWRLVHVATGSLCRRRRV